MDGAIIFLHYMRIMKPDELVFLAGSATPVCRARVDKHFNGYHTLQYMNAGAVEIFYDGERHLLDGFWFWPAMPGPRIRFHPAPGAAAWSHRFVAFAGPLVQDWAQQGLWPAGPQRVARDWGARMDEILAFKDRRERLADLRAARLLELLLLDLAEARQAPRRAAGRLDAVLRELEASNYWPDYARLSAVARMSLPTLRRRFRQAQRISLHAYALQARAGRAAALLTRTDRPIKTIADELGYRDVYFFSRQFRALTGLPPRRFRESRQ